ncbi:MAG: hypothetical protein ACRCZ6_16545 [Kluyvera sp.]|uniref:hypothetical protein n=1 Tax=Kluyvera sp. TaxID=1538228 RepID=UPI003F3681F8
MSNRKDLSGTRYGKLVVIRVEPNPPNVTNNRNKYYLCQCDCGNTHIARASHLTSMKATTCSQCKGEKISAGKLRHGMSNSKIHHVWMGMRARCYNSAEESYQYYGGRGIKVCDRWLHSFDKFLEDMGVPATDESIDRIDVNGDYTPENCRWTTSKIQSRNRRNNRLITINGVTKPLIEWCEDFGLPYKATWQKICKGGARPEDVFNS